MKTKLLIISYIGSILLASGLSWYATKEYYTKPIPIPNPIPIHTNPVISPTIPMDSDLSCELAKSELWHYRNDMPVINWTVLEQSRTNIDVMIDGKFYARTFSQDVSIPIVQAETSNFKLYLGISVGAVATAGAVYGGYKLIKLLK